MKRKPTEQQKQAAAERRQKIREMVKAIAAMPPEEQDRITGGMIRTVEGHLLSRTNMILVAMQGCQSNLVGGFSQWRKAGRQVRKGVHGFAIWVPLGAPKLDDPEDQGSGEVRFSLGTVFGLDQTDPIEAEKAA